jgi:hypothetical protein
MRNALARILLSVSLFACTGTGTDSDGDTDPVSTAICTEATELSCVDDMIQILSLHDDRISTGAVSNVVDGDAFVTSIDATAGGFGQSQNFPWVYIRFTENGAERVDIDDETALEDMTWHLAAKRFILRLNGGSSGPSCVGASPFLEKTFEDLATVPAGTRFVQDDYFTQDCTIVNDSSGLPDSPQVALGAWWEYPGCVATTGVPFLVQLDDGKVLRLRVDSYYLTGQETCNTSATPGSGGGSLTLRWGFVE